MPARTPAEPMPLGTAVTATAAPPAIGINITDQPPELPPVEQPQPQRAARVRRPAAGQAGTVVATSQTAIASALQITAEERAGLRVLDEIEQNCTLQAISTLSSQAERSIMIAKAIRKAETALEPFRETIEAMKGTSLGFKLDKPEQYDWPITRRICAEAMLRGARLTGNEFNGIAKNCYLTQAYFVRRCREWPGVTITQDMYGVPRLMGTTTVVDYTIRYTVDNGPEQVYERVGNQAIPIRVNDGMGADAIIGKAKRKAYAGMMEQLINRSQQSWSPGPDGEVEPPERQRTLGAVADYSSNPAENELNAIGNQILSATPEQLPGLGRTLVETCNARTALWTPEQRTAFWLIFETWHARRLETATTLDIVRAANMSSEGVQRYQQAPPDMLTRMAERTQLATDRLRPARPQ